MIFTREQHDDWSFGDAVAPRIAFKTWRIADGELSSRFLPVTWTSPVLAADCYRDLPTPFRSACTYLDVDHIAPHPGCSCGIYAEITPDLRAPKVDFRAVTGIVALWGRVLDDRDGVLRAEHARVCALGLYAHASRRQQNAVMAVGDRFEADVLDLRELQHAAQDYRKVLEPLLVSSRA